MAFESLFQKYDRLVLFDTETTGLLFNRDEIIEFAAVVVELRNGVPTVTREPGFPPDAAACRCQLHGRNLPELPTAYNCWCTRRGCQHQS